ncbi:baseplate wedge protein [Aeromonas phage ST4]|nr:baseplate wedge protein [Aeromonas phage ST4]
MTMLKRLLGSLHTAVFDTSPDSGLAFFIRHPNGVTWAIADEVLTATVNGQSKTYYLNTMTVGQLAGQLVLDGFEVAGLSPEFSGLSASVLVEGSGNTLSSNGDRLYAFRDLLRSLLGGYARELRTAKAQIGEALKQMVITQAEGEWLDLWGALYNTPRPQGMADTSYQPLIPQEAFRLRVNGYAIEKAILDLTGQRVHIEEPWEGMFRLDESALSGTHRFYDGSSIGYHLIRPVADQAINWGGILDIIERNKAAGVIVLPPEERNRTWVNDPLNGTIWYQRWDLWSRLVRVDQLPRLDDTLRLSAYTIDRNYLTSITSVQMLTSIPDEVNGIFMPSSPSHLLSYGPVLYPQDSEIHPYHTGFYAPSFTQAYPQERKTWRNAGKWRGFQTWAKAYEWRVFSRMTSYSESAFIEANVDGGVTSMSAQGADWNVPESWDDATWNI